MGLKKMRERPSLTTGRQVRPPDLEGGVAGVSLR